jgi:hypothetical protein
MRDKHKGRVYETRLTNQFYIGNCIGIMRYNKLIRLMQWLHTECYHPEANSTIIIRKFFEKSNEIRRKLR